VVFQRTKMAEADSLVYRNRRGSGTLQSENVFHEPRPMPEQQKREVVHMDLPLVYNPNINGLEDTRSLHLVAGSIVAGRQATHTAMHRDPAGGRYWVEQHIGRILTPTRTLALTLTLTLALTLAPALRYCVEQHIGSGSFSTFYKCHDESSSEHPPIGLKVVKNDKDCLDTGCAEIRVLDLIRKHDGASHHLLQMHSFFYWREHLIIVLELQHDALFKFYRSFERDEDRLRFFDRKMMAALSSQMLDALSFLHGHGVAHCDVKSENICLSATRPGHFTLIDMGSAVLTYDVR
jgi:hypothetical protein